MAAANHSNHVIYHTHTRKCTPQINHVILLTQPVSESAHITHSSRSSTAPRQKEATHHTLEHTMPFTCHKTHTLPRAHGAPDCAISKYIFKTPMQSLLLLCMITNYLVELQVVYPLSCLSVLFVTEIRVCIFQNFCQSLYTGEKGCRCRCVFLFFFVLDWKCFCSLFIFLGNLCAYKALMWPVFWPWNIDSVTSA